MEAFKELFQINFSYVFLSVFSIFIGIKFMVSLFEWGIDKLGLETKWMRAKREEHNLIVQTSQNLAKLQEKHAKDMEQSDHHDERIRQELSDFIHDMRQSISDTQKQIETLVCGSKELLGAEIDKRYREYIALDGIPESDVTEFADIFTAYKKLNGNHSRDAKYDYVKNHLSVIPVETKLITK